MPGLISDLGAQQIYIQPVQNGRFSEMLNTAISINFVPGQILSSIVAWDTLL